MSLRKSAFLLSLTAGVVAGLPAAWGQEQPIVEVPTARNTVLGEIIGTSVNVRSGPAESYYPTMRLNKGDKVTVVGHKFDWLKILPPEGSFSLVAKFYVDRNGGSASGTINRDDVIIRAGSTLSDSKAQPQVTLDRGASVEITGEAAEYYKIKPPQGAFLYVTKQFVALAGQAPQTEVAAAGTATTAVEAVQPGNNVADTAIPEGPADATTDIVQVKPPKTVQETGEQPAKTAEKPARPVDKVNAELEAEFRKLELRFTQSSEQPLEEQPVAELLKGYTDLQTSQDQLSATTRRMVTFRVKYLQAVQKQQDELLKAKQEAADFTARQARTETEQRQIERRMAEQGIAVYAAVGKLDTSSVQKDGSPLLRLVDPADGRTLVYIRTAEPQQRGLVGQFVGVRGEVSADSQLGVDYIEPTEVQPVDPTRVLKGVSAKIYPPSIITGAQQ